MKSKKNILQGVKSRTSLDMDGTLNFDSYSLPDKINILHLFNQSF